MRLLIVSHTPHHERASEIVGWGPTVREIDHLAELFDEVTHVAILEPGPAPSSALPYTAPNVRLRLVAPAGGNSPAAKLGILTAYPAYASVIREEMRRANAVHVRCPANISLLALLLLRLTKESPCRWVKYAGNWRPKGNEPWSYTLQRRWLRENRHRGVVTVNGRWPGQPSHVRSFYNPCLTDEEAMAGGAAAAMKTLSLPLELLFVGALNEGKGVGRVLRVAQALDARGIPYRLRLLGDSPDRPRYEAWAREHGLRAEFLGWVSRSNVAEYYVPAHFILLPSQSEGWPKVLSEAMAFGVVPVAAAVSSIPQILSDTGAGVALPPDDIDGMTAAIARFVTEPDTWSAAARAGVAAAHRFTYRYYQASVTTLFAETWGTHLRTPPDHTSPIFAAVGEPARLHSSNGHGYHTNP